MAILQKAYNKLAEGSNEVTLEYLRTQYRTKMHPKVYYLFIVIFRVVLLYKRIAQRFVFSTFVLLYFNKG